MASGCTHREIKYLSNSRCLDEAWILYGNSINKICRNNIGETLHKFISRFKKWAPVKCFASLLVKQSMNKNSYKFYNRSRFRHNNVREILFHAGYGSNGAPIIFGLNNPFKI
jgi:hypothetical protein